MKMVSLLAAGLAIIASASAFTLDSALNSVSTPSEISTVIELEEMTPAQMDEAEALELLSEIPVEAEVASGDVGYRYIQTTRSAVAELPDSSFFVIQSPTDPSAKHIFKADWLTKA